MLMLKFLHKFNTVLQFKVLSSQNSNLPNKINAPCCMSRKGID